MTKQVRSAQRFRRDLAASYDINLGMALTRLTLREREAIFALGARARQHRQAPLLGRA